MTAASSVALVGNMGFRLLTGIFIDRYGYKLVALSFSVVAILCALFFSSVARSELFYALWLFLAQCLFAANMVSASVVALRIFGPETGTQIFPFVQGAIAISNMLLTAIVLNLQDSIGYQGMLNLMAVSSIISLFFIAALKD